MKTFENEAFAVEANEEAGCRLAVKITAQVDPVKKAYKKAVKTVNKQISIPGFRKGRAPDATVISKYGSYVEQEWKEILVNDAYKAALDLTEVYPMNKESIQKPKIESCSLEDGAVITLAYEHYPEIPEIDFSAISIPDIKAEAVSDERVEEIALEVRKSKADWEEIEGRSVEENDYVDVSIDAIDEDPPKSIVKDRRFEVTDKAVAPWMKTLLVGLKIGDAVEGHSEVDPKADADVKKNFKPTHVRITLHSIKKIILPELTDELAKQVGADSVDDLRAKIRTNLETEAADQQQSGQIDALEKALLEKYSFELPATLVESERLERLRRRLEQMKGQGISDEELTAQESAIKEQIEKDVDEALRLYFIEKQIAKQGNISLSNEELNSELARQISQNPYLFGKDMDEKAQQEMVSRLANSLMQRKTKEHALEQVLAK